MRSEEYVVRVGYSGFPRANLDKRVERAVGRTSHSSGFGFDGRDLMWYYATKRAAAAAVQRIKDAKIKGVRVSLLVQERAE